MHNKIIFIPIKEHSDRVERKNFRDFNGVPLYMHTLNKYVGKDVSVNVDTDSQEIIDTIEEKHSKDEMMNIHVYSREECLRGDGVSVNMLIEDFIFKYIPSGFDDQKKIWIAQIHVTNPFLSAKTVLSALGKAEDGGKIMAGIPSDNDEGFDSVASVTTHNCRFWRHDEYGYCPVNHNPMKLEKTQDLPTFYEENSCFYIFNPHNFIEFGSFRVGRFPMFYPVHFPEDMDIDTEYDWKMCNGLEMSGVLK